MTDWQDIASAPKDGTYVLITDGSTAAVASWEDHAVELWGCGWRDVGDIGWGGMAGVQPTHWMPLPEMPGTRCDCLAQAKRGIL